MTSAHDTGPGNDERTSPRGKVPAAGRRDGRRDEAGPRGAGQRVALSHAQTRTTLRFALAFLAGAAVAAAASERWLALHLFLAGGVVLAISGVSLMLTVTWSAAPAPPDRWVTLQRWAVAAGAAGVALSHQADLPAAAWALAGVVYLTGLLGLGALLVITIRRGVERRYDAAVASYLAAVAAGVAGVGVGVAMGTGAVSGDPRGAHLTLNLLGLVGLVVSGTMPYFAATVGRAKMAPIARPRPLVAVLGWQCVALAVAVTGVAAGSDRTAAAGLALYAAGIVGVVVLLPRPTRRQLQWAGPRLLGLWAGAGWWIVSLVATASDAAGDSDDVFSGRWLFVLVVAGFGQILWGSLAYLLPMLRGGGHERLSAGFATTRSWPGLAAVNLAALSAAVGAPVGLTAALTAVWVIDTAWRIARVGTRRAPRPQPPAGRSGATGPAGAT